MLVQGVEGDKNAIGYFGYAYFQENADKLAALKIKGVEPTAETVDKNEYPLARPLFIYTTAKIMQDKPQVASLVNFFLTQRQRRDRCGRLLPGQPGRPGCGQAGLAGCHEIEGQQVASRRSHARYLPRWGGIDVPSHRVLY